jgi:glycolate oxidase FAD binding subunit
VLEPRTPEELADALFCAAGEDRSIALGGKFSKRSMAGPTNCSDVSISTASLQRVLQYEPHDLTISVEAGLAWSELDRTLAANRQMVPLDPPWSASATVGGVIASNSSGPRRRLYGTARDFVIGMKFATLEGKLAQSGGMVVKNVAGLDMAKLMIGSFGTLAAIAVINFKVLPEPEAERSFLLSFGSLADAVAAANALRKSMLQPSAVDLLNPSASAAAGGGWLLAIRVSGVAAAVARHQREICALGDAQVLENSAHENFWNQAREFTPRFLESHPDGAVIRASCTLKETEVVIASLGGPAVARAGSGVCYGYFDRAEAAAVWVADAARRGWRAVVEHCPEERKRELELWPCPRGDLELMKRVKSLFDPKNRLNRGRLYGRI